MKQQQNILAFTAKLILGILVALSSLVFLTLSWDTVMDRIKPRPFVYQFPN